MSKRFKQVHIQQFVASLAKKEAVDKEWERLKRKYGENWKVLKRKK